MAASLKPTLAALLLVCFWFQSISGVSHEEKFPKEYLSSVGGERPLVPRGDEERPLVPREDETSAWNVVNSEYLKEGKRHDMEIKKSMDAGHVLNGHNNLLRNSSRVLIEKLRSEPGLSDFPCPLATDIAPCLCDYDQDFNVDLDCTAVVSEDQLAFVLEHEFPVTKLRKFYMSNNSDIEVLGNILNGNQFEEIVFYPGPFALKEVSDYFLLSTKDTLKSFFVQNSYLDSDSFPFYTLSALEELTNLDFFDSNVSWIPELQGPNLVTTRFRYGFINYIKPGTFDKLPSLMTVDLNHNHISGLGAGTFPIRGRNATFILHSNAITSVQPGAFYFDNNVDAHVNASIKIELYDNSLESLQAETFVFRDSLMTVLLANNQISSIEPGTFVMPRLTEYLSIILHLQNNQLYTFEEDVFGELLPYTKEVLLYGNPFLCGCDVAWLVVNPFRMSKIDNRTTCRDGTYFYDLDPKAFWDVCCKPTLTIDDAWSRTSSAVMDVVKSIWGS